MEISKDLCTQISITDVSKLDLETKMMRWEEIGTLYIFYSTLLCDCLGVLRFTKTEAYFDPISKRRKGFALYTSTKHNHSKKMAFKEPIRWDLYLIIKMLLEYHR